MRGVAAMNWCGLFILLLGVALLQVALAQETEEPENTTVLDVSEDQPSTSGKGIQLDSKLRTALLRALTDLEDEEDSGEEDADSGEDTEQNVARAQASVVIFSNENDEPSAISSLENQLNDSDSNPKEDLSRNLETTTISEEDPTTQIPQEVILQKSESIEGASITSLEKSPLDPIKEAEQIITSASNSLVSNDINGESKHQNEARSVQNYFTTKNKDSALQKEQKDFQSTSAKFSSFTNFNAISNTESKKPSKVTIVEKFSIGKAVDEPNFINTHVNPLGETVKPSVARVKAVSAGVSPKSSVISENINGTSNENVKGTDAVTEATVEVSTEENEAKVEHVQFFSAPLVAAFTVHQDEQGQPKKVEPIYKNGLSSKKEQISAPSTSQAPVLQTSQTILQSASFNTLDLQQQQNILEQELQKLRNQQQNLFSRNNFQNVQNLNNLQPNNQQVYTQTRFNQAVNQNFNQFDPVFTEPDRSIVTKLATIDPSNLLAQNGQFVSRFTPSEAILPRPNPVQPSNFNQVVPQTQQPSFQSLKNSGEVTLVPSISFDPLFEAGKLPKNAQVLPNKEATGFHSFVKLPKTQNFVSQPSSTIVNSNAVLRPQQVPVQNVIQPSVSNFIGSNFQTPSQNLQNTNFFNNQPNKFLKQETSFQGFNNNQPSQNAQFSSNNQNRILRQEQGIGNPGLNQNTFSIVPAQEPFPPKYELSYFPDNNKFLRQNEAALGQPQQQSSFNSNNQNTRFFRGNNEAVRTSNTQNPNRFFRSNLEGIVGSTQNYNIQQSIQPLSPQQLSVSSQNNNRFFRSNQESSLNSPQSLGFNQNNRFLRSNQELNNQNRFFKLLNNQNRFFQTPVLQNYRYSNSFGVRNIPLH